MNRGPMAQWGMAVVVFWAAWACCATQAQADAETTVRPNKLPGMVTSSQTPPPGAADEQQPPEKPETPSDDDPEKHFIDEVPRRSDGDASPTDPRDTDTDGFSILDMLWPLLAVLCGIGLLFWALRKYLPGMRRLTGSQAVEVLARTYVAPRQSIAVVKVGRRILIVGQSSDALSPLGSVSDPEEVSELVGLCASAAPRSASASFRKIFQRMDKEYDAADEGGPSDDDDLRRARSELDELTEKVRRVTGRGK